MIVDCHTHISSALTDADASAHLAAAETVDKCIVLADAVNAGDNVNKKLAEYVSQHKSKLVGFAAIDPTEDGVSVKNLTSVTGKAGLDGVVLYCSNCRFHPAHSRAMRLYESAQELGLPLFFHNGDSLVSNAVLDYSQPFLLDEIAREFSSLKIVIGTMGLPFVEQTLAVVAKHKNVYADLTINPASVWQVYNMVLAAHERGVLDKLLFGSGFPLGKPGDCIEALLGFNKLLGDTNLPTVRRGDISNIIERDTLSTLGINSDRQ